MDEQIELKRRETTLALNLRSIGNEPLEGVAVLLCWWIDLTCSSPIASAQSDKNGIANLKYEIKETDGFVRLEMSKPGIVKASMVFSRPLSYDPHLASRPVVLPTIEEMEFFALLYSVEIDPSRGHAMFYMLDCSAYGAVDLVVSLVPGEQGETTFYARNMFPDPSADRTDPVGIAGFLNLPEGMSNIEAFLFGQEEQPVLRMALPIRAGEITYALIWPQ